MKKILLLLLLFTSCKIVNYNTTDDVYYSRTNSSPVLTKVFVLDMNYTPLVFDYSFSYHRHYNPWYYTSWDNYYGCNSYYYPYYYPYYNSYYYPFYSNYNRYYTSYHYNPYRFYNRNYHYQNNYTYRYVPRTNYNSNRRTSSPQIIQKSNNGNFNRYNQSNTYNRPTTYNRTEPIRNVPQNAPNRVPVRVETPRQNYSAPRTTYTPRTNYSPPRSNYSAPRNNAPRTAPSYTHRRINR